MKKLLILTIFALSSLCSGMNQPLPSPQIGSSVQTAIATVQERLLQRFGSAGLEIVLRAFAWYIKTKDTFFPPKPKPIEFDPIKSLVLSTGRFVNRNKMNIGLTSSTILSCVMIYMGLKNWYQRSQERSQLYNDLYWKAVDDGKNKTSRTIKARYERFPDHAKDPEVGQKINEYTAAVNQFNSDKNNLQYLNTFRNAYTELCTCINQRI